MKVQTPTAIKKFFTVQEANSTLPLVRAIVEDITELARELTDWHDRLSRCRGEAGLSPAHQEEVEHSRTEFDRRQGQMAEYETELEQLGVLLKDYFLGLIDFPGLLHGRKVFLCWKLGEKEVTHWHEIQAGFAGRQKLRFSPALP